MLDGALDSGLEVQGVRVLEAGAGATIGQRLLAKNLLVRSRYNYIALDWALAECLGPESVCVAVLLHRCILDGLVVGNHRGVVLTLFELAGLCHKSFIS